MEVIEPADGDLLWQWNDCGRLQARWDDGFAQGQFEDFCEDLGEMVRTFLQDPSCHVIRASSFPWVHGSEHTPHIMLLQSEGEAV